VASFILFSYQLKEVPSFLVEVIILDSLELEINLIIIILHLLNPSKMLKIFQPGIIQLLSLIIMSSLYGEQESLENT